MFYSSYSTAITGPKQSQFVLLLKCKLRCPEDGRKPNVTASINTLYKPGICSRSTLRAAVTESDQSEARTWEEEERSQELQLLRVGFPGGHFNTVAPVAFQRPDASRTSLTFKVSQ